MTGCRKFFEVSSQTAHKPTVKVFDMLWYTKQVVREVLKC